MTTDTGSFDFHRKMPLSADQLWHIVTDAEMRGQWAAPSEGTILTATVTDLNVGGIERQLCGPKDAPEFEVETRWYRLDAPTDAAFTETVEIGGGAIGTSLVTYRIAQTDEGSELFVHVSVSSFCGPDAASEFKAGWENSLRNIDALAQKMGDLIA